MRGQIVLSSVYSSRLSAMRGYFEDLRQSRKGRGHFVQRWKSADFRGEFPGKKSFAKGGRGKRSEELGTAQLASALGPCRMFGSIRRREGERTLGPAAGANG